MKKTSLFLAIVLFIIGMYVPANALGGPALKRPAQVTIIGIPSARRQACEGKRQLAQLIIKLRDSGNSIETVYGMMISRAISAGIPEESACGLKQAVDNVWGDEGNAESIGLSIFTSCMGDELV